MVCYKESIRGGGGRGAVEMCKQYEGVGEGGELLEMCQQYEGVHERVWNIVSHSTRLFERKKKFK